MHAEDGAERKKNVSEITKEEGAVRRGKISFLVNAFGFHPCGADYLLGCALEYKRATVFGIGSGKCQYKHMFKSHVSGEVLNGILD